MQKIVNKRKIVFVCASLRVGGAEKSLVNLLNMIDHDKVDVSLLLLQSQGEFLKQVPEQVHRIELPPKAKQLYGKSDISLLGFIMTVIKCLSTVIETFRWKDYDVIRAHRWKDVYSKICEPLDGRYDDVIAFQSGDSTYYSFDNIKASRYVTYFHTDISNIAVDKSCEEKYLSKADRIVTISEKCVESIQLRFPEYADKTVCMGNLSSSVLIQKLAGNSIPNEYVNEKGKMIILSVGRLVRIKGFDMAVHAARILKDREVKFLWFIIGEGEEKKRLIRQIKEEGVEDCVRLLGLKTNPYPYMKFSGLIVQSSRYEGKSVVLDEAKILRKPVVVTNYNSVEDQIQEGVDGLICDMNGASIANKIEEAISKMHQFRPHPLTENVEDYMQMLLGDKESYEI